MVSWLAAILLWIGNIILIKKRHWSCFIIFGAGNIIWLFYWLYKGETAAMVLVATFLIQNIWGIISWRKQDVHKK